MTILPIVHRELRAACRRRSTFRVRSWAAVVAMGMTMLSMALLSVSNGRRSGGPLFGLLTGYAFGLCLLAGPFLTGQAMAEEKRQGTLGLLFLTDLKGYDVVLGKFFAISLNAFYGLLALTPMTALPILVGGVTGAEFWRMALAQANALFFSMAAGMCVSVFMRDSQRSMVNTLGLVLLLAAALPLLVKLCLRLGLAPWLAQLAAISPFTPFSLSREVGYAGHPGSFWFSLLVSNLVGWSFLAAASIALPRIWQEKPKGDSARTAARVERPAQTRTRLKGRGALLSQNPVVWLMNEQLGGQGAVWAVVLAWGLVVSLVVLFQVGREGTAILIGYVVIPFGWVLKALFTVQACRFFVEGRRSGSLELLLCTPLTSREIIWGQALAVWRRFAWPLAIFVAFLFLPAFTDVLRNLFDPQTDPRTGVFQGWFLGGLYALRMAADLGDLCWMGMAMARRLKNPGLAPGVTLLFVLILPSILSFCLLDIVADLFFIRWGKRKCEQDLRRLVTQQYQKEYVSPMPIMPQPAR